MKACYYCKRQFTEDNPSNNCYYCWCCARDNDLKDVITTFDDNDNVKYTHIYYDAPNDNQYHIRIEFNHNKTVVSLTNSLDFYKPIFVVEGFPFNLKNVKERLKTYLVFS